VAVGNATIKTVCVECGSQRPGDPTAREGQVEDADTLASLMFMAPGREAVAMAGTATAARRLAAILLRHAIGEGTSFVIVAEIGSEPVGFAEMSHGGDMPAFAVVARAAVNAMGLVGALRAGWRSLARLKVDLPAPEGGAHLVELQVSPQHRNQGVGAFLLREVDAYAIEQGAAHISLTTATDNPARRLYERNGYRVAGRRTNARYERITGSAGRVLMVKQIVTS
jgi:ribosomal protein S18 acetylase RimI-like enzyme